MDKDISSQFPRYLPYLRNELGEINLKELIEKNKLVEIGIDGCEHRSAFYLKFEDGEIVSKAYFGYGT